MIKYIIPLMLLLSACSSPTKTKPIDYQDNFQIGCVNGYLHKFKPYHVTGNTITRAWNWCKKKHLQIESFGKGSK